MENKQRIKKALYIVLSILVGAAIWVAVDQTSNNGNARLIDKEFTGLPIVYENEDVLADQGLMLLTDGTDFTVDLKLSGTRWDISSVDPDDITVKVDLGSITAIGSQRATATLLLPDSGKFTRTLSTITVNIAELYRKTVDVRCELTGTVADGYKGEQLQLSHTSIEIRGQKEDIDPVSYVKTTLDLGQNIESTVSEDLTYQFYDKNDQIIDNSEGRIHTTVETIRATVQVTMQKELPLRINFIDSAGARQQNVDAHLDPQYIMVSGDAAKLKNVNSITLADFDLLSLEDGVATYAYPITVPEGCQNSSGVTRATLTISWKDMTSAEVVTNSFQYENLPEGKTASVVTQEMTVRIFGTAEDVAAVTGEDVVLVADLSGYSAVSGSYTVPATVKISSGGDVGVSGDYQIQVTIRDRGEESETAPDPEVPEE